MKRNTFPNPKCNIPKVILRLWQIQCKRPPYSEIQFLPEFFFVMNAPDTSGSGSDITFFHCVAFLCTVFHGKTIPSCLSASLETYWNLRNIFLLTQFLHIWFLSVYSTVRLTVICPHAVTKLSRM